MYKVDSMVDSMYRFIYLFIYLFFGGGSVAAIRPTWRRQR